jgi:hypothetical protein
MIEEFNAKLAEVSKQCLVFRERAAIIIKLPDSEHEVSRPDAFSTDEDINAAITKLDSALSQHLALKKNAQTI